MAEPDAELGDAEPGEAELPNAVMVYRRGVSEDAFREQLLRTITHPAWTLASDGLYHGGLPHPRGYG